MRYEPLSPLGALVEDVAVGDAGPDDADALRDVLAAHGVIVLRHQAVDNDAFLRFLRLFGKPMFTEGETPVEGYPDLNVITNVGRTSPPKSTFHVDTTYIPRPPTYTALRAVEVPAEGGQTLFTDQYEAYASLPAADRSFAEGRTVTHRVTGLEGRNESATHPLVLRHPISHRRSLYLTAPARCVAVSGMSDPEAAEFVHYLVDHSTRDQNIHRHSWAPGDVVMWDNRCVMHRADHSGVVGDRVMHRGMVIDSTARSA